MKSAIPMARVRLNKDEFQLSEANVTSGFCKYIREITDEEKQRFGYFPTIEICSCGNIDNGHLTLRFSAPRLIYDSNLFEITESDFDKVILMLHQKLQNIGIFVSESDIKNSAIWELHTCQNFDMTNNIGVENALKTLNKLVFSKKLDNSDTVYIHEDSQKYNFIEGSKFGLMCKSYEVCFYDKYKQICQDQKSREFMEAIKEQTGIEEVLRFEYRLYKSASVKKALNDAGLKQNLTFEQIFKREVVQKLNANMWYKLFESKMFLISQLACDSDSIIDRIKSAGIKGKNGFDIYNAHNIYNSEGGFKAIIELFDPKSKVLSRLISKVKSLPPAKENITAQTFQMIKDGILNPKPLIRYVDLIKKSNAIHY